MEIKELGEEVKRMTVLDIAQKIDKSERYVKTYLTRNGIACVDYDGEGKKAANLQRTSAVEKIEAPENIVVYQSGPTASESIAALKKEGESLSGPVFSVYGIFWLGFSFWGFNGKGLSFFLPWAGISVVIFMASIFTYVWLCDKAEKTRLSSNKMSEDEMIKYAAAKNSIREEFIDNVAQIKEVELYGNINENLICPHCQTRGRVSSKSAEEVTSTKVVPVIGNTIKARKKVTQMHCRNCDTTWNV